MATKKKWYQGWKTVVGAIMGGAAVFAAQIPSEAIIGSVMGVKLTVGVISAILGGMGVTLGGVGVAGKLEGMKSKE